LTATRRAGAGAKPFTGVHSLKKNLRIDFEICADVSKLEASTVPLRTLSKNSGSYDSHGKPAIEEPLGLAFQTPHI